MIIGNFNVFNKNPGRALGGPSDPTLWFKAGTSMNFYTQSDCTISKICQASFPGGSRPPYSVRLAPKGGELAIKIDGTGRINTNVRLKGNKAIVAPLVGSGIINPAALDLLVGMVAELEGTGTLNASLAGGAAMIAVLTGEGTIDADLGALANLIAALDGSGNVVTNLTAIGFMVANLSPFTPLSPESLAASVWNALASKYNTSGTMGEKLNAAGTAGDPWTTDLTGYNTKDTAGKIIKQIKSIGQAGL